MSRVTRTKVKEEGDRQRSDKEQAEERGIESWGELGNTAPSSLGEVKVKEE